jgi:hypothetical protein
MAFPWARVVDVEAVHARGRRIDEGPLPPFSPHVSRRYQPRFQDLAHTVAGKLIDDVYGSRTFVGGQAREHVGRLSGRGTEALSAPPQRSSPQYVHPTSSSGTPSTETSPTAGARTKPPPPRPHPPCGRQS